MAESKIRRFGGVLTAFIIIFCYIVIPAGAQQYNTNYPSYIPYVGAKFVEVNSSLGVGSVILSGTLQENSISIGRGSSNLYNCTSSNISGIFRTAQGVDYNIRATAYNEFQYAVSSGYQTTYYDLDVSQILATNIEFKDYSGSDKQNDNYKFDTNVSRGLFALSVIQIIQFTLIIFILLFKGKSYA